MISRNFVSLFFQDGFIKYAPGEDYRAYDRGVEMDIFVKDSGGVNDLIGNVSKHGKSKRFWSLKMNDKHIVSTRLKRILFAST